MAEKKRKSIAPTTDDELPNERRCKNDFTLIAQFEDLKGNVSWYCPTCGTQYGNVLKEGE